MTEKEYMSLAGWNSDLYMIITPEQYEEVKAKPGAVNNNFAIQGPIAKKAFGQNAKVVKKDWYEKHTGGEPTATVEVPPVPKEVPPPPVVEEEQDIDMEDEVSDDSSIIEDIDFEELDRDKKEAEQEEAEQYDRLLKKRLDFIGTRSEFTVLEDERKVKLNRNGVLFTYDEIVEMDNATYGNNFIFLPKPEPTKDVGEDLDGNIHGREPIEEKEKPSKVDEKVQQTSGDDIANAAFTVVNDSDLDVSEALKHPEIGDFAVKKHGNGTSNGFFTSIERFDFSQISVTIIKANNGKLKVIVKPDNDSGDDALDMIRPLAITGTAKEFDDSFFDSIAPSMEIVGGLISNAKAFLDDAKKAEKNTRSKKEEEIRVIKSVKDDMDKKD